jgi:probable F420-dependent oxidoreductase
MADSMKLGLYGLIRGATGVDPEIVARRARRAEQVGFESVWVGDHLALPPDAGGDRPRLEVVAALSYLAAATERLRLGFGVIVLPQRQPVLLAKQLTTVDVLSGGRVLVGIGVGYVEPELRALGASLADRGARTDEYLAVLRALWTGEPVSYAGRFVSFPEVVQLPPPRQRPHPPIVVGGHSPAALRRAVRSGQGWYAVFLDVDQTATALAELRQVAAGEDRPAELGELEITVTPPGPVDLATARRYADLGVHRLVLQSADVAGSDLDELIDSAAETLIGRV